MPYSFDGAVGVADGLLPWSPRKPGTLVEVHCRFGSAPSSTTIRVRKNESVTVGSVTISGGNKAGSFTPNHSYVVGDYFTVDITAAGSPPGSNLVVQLLSHFS
jgi:hypothetical protein